MADLPDTLQCPAPPFTNAGLDLLGPITIKAMVNKRARIKVWVVIFVCLNTKAVSMELAPGYSTNDFMLAYSSYVSQRGEPGFVHSDRGTQLVSAQKLLNGRRIYPFNKGLRIYGGVYHPHFDLLKIG